MGSKTALLAHPAASATRTKLTGAIVLRIRRSRESIRVWAARLQVRPQTIWNARVGKTWAHLPEAQGKRRLSCLSTASIRAIRRDKTTPQSELARRHKVSRTTIWRIQNGHSWVDPRRALLISGRREVRTARAARRSRTDRRAGRPRTRCALE